MPDKLTLVYYDMRSTDFPDYFEITMDLFRRQTGILMHHKRNKPGGVHLETCTKKKHGSKYEQIYVSPIYPAIEVPTLIELLNRDVHPEHDELRFNLLEKEIFT